MNNHRLLAYCQGDEIVMLEGNQEECREALHAILTTLREKGRTITESPGGNRATVTGKFGGKYRYRISSPVA